MTHRLRILAVLMLPAVLLGCTVDNRGDPGDRGDAGDTAPSVTGPDGVRPADDTPRDDMTDERIIPWTSAEEVGPATLRVTFMAGTTSCYGTRAVVRENAEEVLVAAVSGTVPDAPSACPDVGRDASLLVELDDEVGDREVKRLDDDSILRR
ncbi:hypothetical protein [Corynebacterium sp.]|uniref:hypothetical protein n=1 Tax=Corynebacterium sp. TaxID=1720 RepID=UPI0025B81BB0|nr:hypothetical protein [Corynebacterium sp.]